MRIVTRPDFDGIVCAVVLKSALSIDKQIYWVEPNEVQSGSAQIQKGDILTNLPYSENCSLWFDHHVSNQPDFKIKGAFYVAPSAAGVVYKYYRKKGLVDNQFDELIKNTDIIDAADLTLDQVRHPERYPYILLSMTIKNNNYEDIDYWNLLVDLLLTAPIKKICDHPDVKKRCQDVIEENKAWESYLRNHTKVEHQISVTDFRSLKQVPDGNRFITYCLFPDSIASVKIRYSGSQKRSVQLSIGKSLFNRQCRVNIGRLLSRFGGGGHDGAGGCTLDAKTAPADIDKILDVLYANPKETKDN